MVNIDKTDIVLNTLIFILARDLECKYRAYHIEILHEICRKLFKLTSIDFTHVIEL